MSNARMRSVTNYFIVNLSIADIMNASLNVVPNFTYMLTGNWPFGEEIEFVEDIEHFKNLLVKILYQTADSIIENHIFLHVLYLQIDFVSASNLKEQGLNLIW